MKPRWVWLCWVPAFVTAVSALLMWVDARRHPDHWGDSGVGLICFIAALEWVRATVCGVVYVLAMKGVVRLMHRFRVYRHGYVFLVSVGAVAGIGGLAGARGAIYGGAVGAALALIFVLVHRPQVALSSRAVSFLGWARELRVMFALRWVRVGVGFVLPLLLGALLLALLYGDHDGSWLDSWVNGLPMVVLFMGGPVLVYTVVMEVVGSRMRVGARWRAGKLIALSAFLGAVASGPLMVIGVPVGVVCGGVLVLLRV